MESTLVLNGYGWMDRIPIWIYRWLEMMHRAEEVPFCFLRSSVKFQGHTDQKIDNLAQIWAFPDDNSNLNKRMAMK